MAEQFTQMAWNKNLYLDGTLCTWSQLGHLFPSSSSTVPYTYPFALTSLSTCSFLPILTLITIWSNALLMPTNLLPLFPLNRLEDVIDIVAKAGITYPPYPQNDSHPEVKSSLQDKSSSSYHDTHLNRDVVESNTNTGDLHTNPSTPEQQEESEIKANARYPRANHILINEYKIGEGISAHLDGPAYSPQAVILSLSTPTSLLFWKDYPDTYVNYRYIDTLLYF